MVGRWGRLRIELRFHNATWFVGIWRGEDWDQWVRVYIGPVSLKVALAPLSWTMADWQKAFQEAAKW